MVQELERRGARVACTYTGGLDFSVPVQERNGGETAQSHGVPCFLTCFLDQFGGVRVFWISLGVFAHFGSFWEVVPFYDTHFG